MKLPPPKACQTILKLYTLILRGSPHEKEVQSARARLAKLLKKYELDWDDVPGIVTAARQDAGQTRTASSQAATAPVDGPSINVLDLVLHLIEEHVSVT